MIDFKKIKHLYGDRYRSIWGKWKTNCCAMSGLPLKTGDPVVIIPIIGIDGYRNGWIKIYKPAALPVFGKYSPTIGLQYQRKPDKCEKIINSMTELILGSMALFPGEVKKGRIRKRWSSFIQMIQKQPEGYVPGIFLDQPIDLQRLTKWDTYKKYELRLVMIHKEIYLDMMSTFRAAWSDIPSSYFQEDGNEVKAYRKHRYDSLTSTHIADLLELLGRFYYHGLTKGEVLDMWNQQHGYLFNAYFTGLFSEYHFEGIVRLVKRYREVLRSKQIEDDFSIKLLVEQFKDLWILDHIMGYLRKPWCKEDSNYDDDYMGKRVLSPEILLKYNEVVSKFIKNHYPVKGDLEKEKLYRGHAIHEKPM